MNPTDEYRYQCVDRSLAFPILKKYYLQPLYKFVPAAWSANGITLGSCALIAIVCLINFCDWGLNSFASLLLCALLIHGYIVGDILDGMRAKATQTSSRLGEFLDHGSDSYLGGIVMAATLSFAHINSLAVFFISVGLIQLLFVSTMMEEKITGVLQFGAIGNLESLLSLQIGLVLALFPSLRAFFYQELIGQITLVHLLFMISLLCIGYYAYELFKRMMPLPKQWFYYSLCLIALIYLFLTLDVERPLGLLVIICYSGEYSNRMIKQHLLKTPGLPWPDQTASVAIVFLTVATLLKFLTVPMLHSIFYFIGAYIIARAVFGFVTAYRQLS